MTPRQEFAADIVRRRNRGATILDIAARVGVEPRVVVRVLRDAYEAEQQVGAAKPPKPRKPVQIAPAMRPDATDEERCIWHAVDLLRAYPEMAPRMRRQA